MHRLLASLKAGDPKRERVDSATRAASAQRVVTKVERAAVSQKRFVE
jgi:hypothetical protein